MYLAPGRQVWFKSPWGQTSIRLWFWKFLILGQGRDLVCRDILYANYLPLSHRKDAVLSPKYEKPLIEYLPTPSRYRSDQNPRAPRFPRQNLVESHHWASCLGWFCCPLQCPSTGPHLSWLLTPVGIGDCGDDVQNVSRCQRACFRITRCCGLRALRISGSLVVWTLPFLPNHIILVPSWGILLWSFRLAVWCSGLWEMTLPRRFSWL